MGSGLPKPQLFWRYNNTLLPVKTYSQMEISHPAVNLRGSFVVQSTLTIQSVQNDANQGNYTCVVKNMHQPEAQATATISVNGMFRKVELYSGLMW